MSTPRLYSYDVDTHTATCRTCWISEVDLLPEEAGPWHAGHHGQCEGAPADRPSATVLSFRRPAPTVPDAVPPDAGGNGLSTVDLEATAELAARALDDTEVEGEQR